MSLDETTPANTPFTSPPDDDARLAAQLDEFGRLHAAGKLSDTEFASATRAAIEGSAEQSTPASAVAATGRSVRRGSLVAWILGVALLLLAVAGIVAWAVTRGDERPAADGGSVAAYRAESQAARNRLVASSRVLSRRLERTGTAASLTALIRTSNQQLAAVNKARAELEGLTPSGAEATRAHGLLVRASGLHRQLLLSLTRIDVTNPNPSIKRFSELVTSGRAAFTAYRDAARAAGLQSASMLAAQGLAELGGLRQALVARRDDLASRAAAERRSVSGGGGGGGGGYPSSSGRVAVTGVSGTDLGSVLRIVGDYCDRTPGRVNSFTYTATIYAGGSPVTQGSASASQTRACNSIAIDIADTLGLGTYDVRFTVDNLTNGVSASGTGVVTVTN